MGELENKRLDVKTFKGPALSCNSYGDLTKREYTDIDLVVDKFNIAEVKQV